MAYAALTPDDRKAMLAELRLASIGALFKDIPEKVRLRSPLGIPEGLSEQEVSTLLSGIAGTNRLPRLSFLGAGAYRHYIPAAVDQLLLRGEFFTAYTPYQAEASQGSLQAIFEFQTLICQLTGMDLANASVYDGATALAEAAVMAAGITSKKDILVSDAVHPHYRQVLKTYARGGRLVIRELPSQEGGTDPAGTQAIGSDTAAVIVQSPNFFGVVEDYRALADDAHRKGALLIALSCEATSLGILKPAGEMGADIAVGEAQSFGSPLSFGGPHCGFMATREEHMRHIPGRLVGQTLDSEGKRGFTLTLQAREQHIRREKATSNICTSQQLNALACAIHLALLGPNLRELAELNLQKAAYARKALSTMRVRIPHEDRPHYNEFIALIPDAGRAHASLAERDVIAGLPLKALYPDRKELRDALLLCVTEMNSREEIDELASLLGGPR